MPSVVCGLTNSLTADRLPRVGGATICRGDAVVEHQTGGQEDWLPQEIIPVLRNLNSCTYDKPTSGCWVRNATHLFHPKGRQLSQPTLELRTL
ncbi:hypothetical protein C0Q70_21212 [Pomacea canaliculata]|uniref:Uncharacterized protein n=1 Tax=Pomacea canaliculata TaxID=400727 RepID=A0A2T7NBY8_POMCA|nr:hypothetical protein C0Q70_21212 [Pomacea canaliculata]